MAFPNNYQVGPSDDASKTILRPTVSSLQNSDITPSRLAPMLHSFKRRRICPPASSSSCASASRWFDNANLDVNFRTQSNSGFDQDPPFFLDHKLATSSQKTDEGVRLPETQTLDRALEIDSENEDLRSVVDDLTVENKRLKHLLHQHRQNHNPVLNQDRIFEVRTHGLSTNKKRELDSILQTFASNINNVSSNDFGVLNGPRPLAPTSFGIDDTSQSRPHFHNADSGYASLSASGPTSVEKSTMGRKESQSMNATNEKNVRSYLRGIPDRPSSNSPTIMNEQLKKRVVVKRLEQLFTGCKAATGEHIVSLQQQKTSDSAALADRHRLQLLNRSIRPEGTREAHILPFGSKMDLDPAIVHDWPKAPGSQLESRRSSDDASASGNRSPDQRPTRPVDLDELRASVAEDNMQYIRHLGLPTPTANNDASGMGDNWVYLNLLVNMAQLHTMNVTPAFVQKSISDLSTRFELSKDGRKVRWKGGEKTVETPDEHESETDAITGGSNLAHSLSADTTYKESLGSDNQQSGAPLDYPSRPSKASPSDRNHAESAKASAPSNSKSTSVHLAKLDMSQELSDESDNMGRGMNATPDTANSSPIESEDDGPVIYYRNCPFYCDLSRSKNMNWTKVGVMALPEKGVLGLSRRCRPDFEDEDGRLDKSEIMPEPPVSDNQLPSLKLEPLAEVCEDEDTIIDLPVSGLGGVQPADHFSLLVRRRHQPKNIRRIQGFRDHKVTDKGSEEVVSSTRIDLPAAKLPPPSYLLMSSESSSGNDANEYFSEDPEESDDDVEDEILQITNTCQRRFSTNDIGWRRYSYELDDRVERSDSGSVEMLDASNSSLGSAAPDQTIELTTGSLAATVGDGSATSVR